MQRYRVETAIAGFGSGALLGVTRKQFEPRAARLENLEERTECILVRVIEPIEFKIGEVIWLDTVDRHHEKILVALDVPQTHEPGGEGGGSADDTGEKARAEYVAKVVDEATAAGAARGDVVYDAMTREQLDKLAAERGIDAASAKNKGDVIALLQRADKVDDAIAASEFDALTIDELTWLAEEGQIDVGAAKVKADYVALFAPAAA